MLRPYSEVRAQLLSGSWAPRIEELVYIPPGDPKIVPTSAMRQTYTVVDTCFTKRITPMGIYVLLASPENVEKVGADNFRATYGQLVPKYRRLRPRRPADRSRPSAVLTDHSWKRYPIPASVSRCLGCAGSISSLRRSCARYTRK